jgi:23S rRNA pseudouridine1911/1915/1917 synthase
MLYVYFVKVFKFKIETTMSVQEQLDWEEHNEQELSENLFEFLKITIDKEQEPLRIDKFLANRIEGATRNKIQNAIDNGKVLANGKTVEANYKIKPGDDIIVYTNKERTGEEIIPQKMPLDIVFEDKEVLIINKPPGLVVHPASGNPDGTLINGVAYYLQQENASISEDTLPRFGLVHRIDKNTSGLMVLAKTSKAAMSLAKQFFNHTINRIYIALVWGNVEEDNGTVIAHVGRHKRFRKLFDAYPDGEYGKEAITHYTVLERLGYVTLIQCKLETGRTHQIRVHMQHIGHPLFNDDTYGGDRIVKGTVFAKYKQFVENCFAICPRHTLHAKTIGFVNPTNDTYIEFTNDLPKDMQTVIDKWRNYIQPKNN